MAASDEVNPHDSAPGVTGLFFPIFEQAAVGLAQIETATGRFLRVNQRYCDIVGYSRQELELLDFQTITHTDDLEAELGNMRRLVADEIREFTMEKRYRHKDGHVVWVNLTVSPLRRPGESFTTHLAVVEDITAHKRAESVASQQARELAALNALSSAVNAELSVEQTKAAGLQGMLDAVRPDMAFLFLREGDRLILQEVLPSAAWQRLGAIPEHRLGQCICGLAAREGRPLYSRDIFSDLRCTWEECKQAGLRSFAALPLCDRDEVIGVIGLASGTERDFEQQAGFMETLAGQVSAALVNARLYEALRRELAERKRAEEALREIEQRYRALHDRSLLCVYTFGFNGHFLDANQAVLDLLGYSLDEFTTLEPESLLTADQLPHLRQRIEQNLSTGYVLVPAEWRVRRKDGEYVFIETVSAVIYREGKPFALQSVGRDVTERKRAEEALRTSEQGLREAQSLAQLGSYVLDIPIGRWTSSAALDELFGIDASYGRSVAGWAQIVHPADRAMMVDYFQNEVLTQGRSFEKEYRIVRHHDGTELWVHGRGRLEYDAGGHAVKMLGTIQDITERKRAEQTLRESEARYRELFENSPVGIYRSTPKGHMVAANPALLRMLGYSSFEQLAAVNLEQHGYGPGYDRAAFRQMIERHGEIRNLETSLLRQDGTPVEVRESTKAIRDSLGATVYYEGIVEDISEQKRAEAERAKTEEKLIQAQKMESVGRLAGGIAHDFNNLLTVINGYSDIMLKRIDPRDPLHVSLSEVRKAGERAAELTQQMLTFSRKQIIDPRPLDLNRLVADNCDMIGRMVGEDIELATHLEPGLGLVLADAGQLHRVLMNLVVNARDAMPHGGRLLIGTADIQIDRDFADTYPGAREGDYVLLRVTDTGVGMDEATRQHIFEPFFTTKGEGEGTGLGLSTVYGIVQQGGGWINVETALGQGTTFAVGLPRTTEQARPEPDSPAPVSTTCGNETVLLVEDQDEVRKLALTVLGSNGYRVLEARNGDEALSIAERHSGALDLILTDVVMPGMSGKELAERLHAVRPDVKVLYMSGYPSEVLANHGIMDTGIAWIAKPFAPDDLSAKVRAMLGPPRGRVLVADDDEAICKLFDSVLSAAGYEVVRAEDGDQALKLIGEQEFDVLVTDLVMPNREGLETIRAIREGQSRLKIIAVSGALGGGYLKVAATFGADATLMKPVGPKELLAAVGKVLAQRAPDSGAG